MASTSQILSTAKDFLAEVQQEKNAPCSLIEAEYLKVCEILDAASNKISSYKKLFKNTVDKISTPDISDGNTAMGLEDGFKKLEDLADEMNVQVPSSCDFFFEITGTPDPSTFGNAPSAFTNLLAMPSSALNSALDQSQNALDFAMKSVVAPILGPVIDLIKGIEKMLVVFGVASALDFLEDIEICLTQTCGYSGGSTVSGLAREELGLDSSNSVDMEDWMDDIGGTKPKTTAIQDFYETYQAKVEENIPTKESLKEEYAPPDPGHEDKV